MNSDREKKIDYLIRFGMIAEEFHQAGSEAESFKVVAPDYDQLRTELMDESDEDLDKAVSVVSAFVAKLRTLP